MLEGSESRETYQKEAACIVFYCQNFISYFLNAKVNFEKNKLVIFGTQVPNLKSYTMVIVGHSKVLY